ncbi:MAG: WS/DGAT/MGAT family O-acyltransferase [Myxococcota bacterium]
MKCLSGLDATFLYAETATTPMNVVATIVVEGRLEFDALLSRIEARLPCLPPFRRRLVEMPFSLGHPMWIEDPDFDVREHVVRATASPPGDARALARIVEGVARRRLDRARPLWEIVVVDGLAEDRTALVVKAHHAALDGVSGAALLLHLFDRGHDEARDPSEVEDAWRPDPEPSAAELLGRGLGGLRDRPGVWSQALRRAGRSAGEIARAHWAPDAPIRDAALPFQAPDSPWNGPVSARRGVAYARTSLESIARVRAVYGGTVNDVVLTACTRALQGELIERRALPETPLVAAVPVSTRPPGEAPDAGNRISAFLTQLPVQLEDPLHQLTEVSRSTRRSKRLHAALGDGTLGALAELATPGLTRRAFEAYSRWKLAAAHRPLFNLIVSNVPGPPVALALLGRPVRAIHPHGPLMEGAGLNITVLSYAGSVDVGVLACGERVPEAHRLADRVAGAIEELAKLAEAELPEIPPLARECA